VFIRENLCPIEELFSRLQVKMECQYKTKAKAVDYDSKEIPNFER